VVTVINISGCQVSVDTMRTILGPGERLNMPMTKDELLSIYPDLTILADRKHIKIEDHTVGVSNVEN
jgi:hypothetical protein